MGTSSLRYRPGQRRLRGALQLACHVWIWVRYNGLMWFDALGLPWSSQSVPRDGRMRPGRRMADWAKTMAFANETARIQCHEFGPASFTRCVATCMPRRHKCMTHLVWTCELCSRLHERLRLGHPTGPASFTRRVATCMPRMDMDAL